MVETAVSTNQKPTMYRNLYENTGPGSYVCVLNDGSLSVIYGSEVPVPLGPLDNNVITKTISQYVSSVALLMLDVINISD